MKIKLFGTTRTTNEGDGLPKSKYEDADITVVNWNKYNPRRDSKHRIWLRMDADIIFDPKLFGLNCDQKWLWILILCSACKSGGESFSWNAAYIESVTGVEVTLQDQTIDFLIKKGMIKNNTKVTSSNIEVTSSNIKLSCSTNERTNERTNGLCAEEKKEDQSGKQPTALSAHALPPLARVWNENRDLLPEVKSCGTQRTRLAQARWREKPDPRFWRDVVTRISRSPFCTGRNDRGWVADFDFLIRPETATRVLEGKYDRQGDLIKPKKKTMEDYLRESADLRHERPGAPGDVPLQAVGGEILE